MYKPKKEGEMKIFLDGWHFCFHSSSAEGATSVYA